MADRNLSLAPNESSGKKGGMIQLAFTCPRSQKRRTKRTFTVFGITFQCAAQNMHTLLDVVLSLCTHFVEKIVLCLGPLLICFAMVIIAALSHTFFTILVPMMHHLYTPESNLKNYSNEEQITFWKLVASMFQHDYSRNLIVMLHVCFVFFLLVNIMFNYFMCVTTRNKGQNYDLVVRELAVATNFLFPETPSQLESFRLEYEERMLLRVRRRQARERQYHGEEPAPPGEYETSSQSITKDSNAKEGGSSPSLACVGKASGRKRDFESNHSLSNNGVTQRRMIVTSLPSSSSHQRAKQWQASPSAAKLKKPSPKLIRNWMLMAPDEWGYCARSNQAKPPRSHYDYVTKTLVLCLDHYCPWMFNAIGYFNYRYFCNFLWFVELGMIYGVCMTLIPFQNLSTSMYKDQILHFRHAGKWKRLHPMTPFPYERMAISLSFMLCLAVGIAVFCLAGFHMYLVFTGQTTIEFHGNWVARKKFNQEQRSLVSRGHGDGQGKKLALKKWQNPYDKGWKRNWQQVYGTGNPLWAVIVPSTRQPEFLPLPLSGEIGRRRRWTSN